MTSSGPVGKNGGPISVDQFEVGSRCTGAGQVWVVGVDPSKHADRQKFFVPSKALVFNSAIKDVRFRNYAIPRKYKNKHRFLPQARRDNLAPVRPLPIRCAASGDKEKQKQATRLKKEAIAYITQRNKFLNAKNFFLKAQSDMEKCMGILPVQEIAKLEANVTACSNFISNTRDKIMETEKMHSAQQAKRALTEQEIATLQLSLIHI